ncbi:AbrB family transcriptional regulator [Scytonema hofmannii PCC 7110]|uniref:AbrB family transcriptional regulator n=1 Tax=Scytonema hofmannii PCC 7110 TaxID=128403 RepID=A0A139XEU5_9CYAN|nr:AbrB/MazE/SpoVT family DNA-binding domain-containing protein [Scytonema hofmannii]KYC43199.1 AbrB family transcriptional regulator [Scytonema hofmannii PCC 7110]
MDYRVEIQKGGRVTIPSVIRKKLKMVEGDIVTIREENGNIKLIPQHQALAKARSLAQQYLTRDDTVDDFLKWRKEEAIAEDDKMNRAFETK